jgi:hypothetical protein
MIEKHTNLEAQAVIAGNNPGWVFVDDVDYPLSALVWSQGIAGFYLMGDEANHAFNTALVPFIEDALTPLMKQREYTHCEISGTHKKWDPTIRQLFADKNVRSWVQRVYTYTHKVPPNAKPVPKDFAIVPLDKKLLSSSCENVAYVVEEIEKFWHSVRVFTHDGFAYCAVKGNTIASICYLSFRTDKGFALGVETFEPYRNRGLAQALAAKCVAQTLQEKAVPYWDCTDTNIGSLKFAEGLGFKKQWEYNCYGYRLDV